jgi:hypothetical protein
MFATICGRFGAGTYSLIPFNEPRSSVQKSGRKLMHHLITELRRESNGRYSVQPKHYSEVLIQTAIVRRVRTGECPGKIVANYFLGI